MCDKFSTNNNQLQRKGNGSEQLGEVQLKTLIWNSVKEIQAQCRK